MANEEQMVKVKVGELSGAALDWVVAKCERLSTSLGDWYDPDEGCQLKLSRYASGSVSLSWLSGKSYSPSTDWAQGGPISESNHIWVRYITHDDATKNHWVGISGWFPKIVECTGPTELIAKMRSYATSKLGAEIEIPIALHTPAAIDNEADDTDETTGEKHGE
jgi:hypothetical protein